MPPTITRPLPSQAPARPGRAAAGWLAAALAALALAAGAGPLLDPPATVDLEVVNGSAWPVTVVLDGGSGPDLVLATVDPGEERAVEQVLDQGDEWLVSYLVAGEVVAEQALPRAELAEQGFRLTVPVGADG